MSSIIKFRCIFFVSVLLFLSCSSSKHSVEQDSAYAIIQRLNWKSFRVTYNYASALMLDDETQKLIATKDQGKIKKLVEHIQIPNKSVVIHIILTNLIEQKKGIFKSDTSYTKDSILFIHYSFNGIHWKFSEQNRVPIFEILPSEIEKVNKYWRSKLKSKLIEDR